MTRLAVLCSGQGAQAPGMFDLVAEAPEAQAIFAAAAPALGGRDPREVVASDRDRLHHNATAQVLCCTQALAAWAALKGRIDARFVVAGYSVGEVAAWGVAGAVEPAGVFEIVAERAALMDRATKVPSGLLAVSGLGALAVERLCDAADVHVAIRNAPDRVVLGGTRDALGRARARAESTGARVTPLSVAVPSHTPLLREAAEAFAGDLRGRRDVRPPGERLISGIDGDAVFDVRVGLDKLARQVAQTVDWAACLEACRSFGATRALELGPGDALARMMGEAIGRRDSRSVAEFHSLDGVIRWLAT